ncbi:unnamed protein product, partial [marine sediment metagenome]
MKKFMGQPVIMPSIQPNEEELEPNEDQNKAQQIYSPRANSNVKQSNINNDKGKEEEEQKEIEKEKEEEKEDIVEKNDDNKDNGNDNDNRYGIISSTSSRA